MLIDEFKLYGPDYLERINKTNELRRTLTLKLIFFKILIAFLLMELIVLPWYINITYYFLYKFPLHLESTLINLGQVLNFISLIIFFSAIIFSYQGRIPFIEIVSIVAFLIVILFDVNYILWPLKVILIFLMLKLGRLLEKFQKAYTNYEDYSTSFKELKRLNELFNNLIGTYLITGLTVIAVVYGFLVLFNLVEISLGISFAIFVAVFILPPLIIYMFNSPAVFKQQKKGNSIWGVSKYQNQLMFNVRK